MVVQMVRIGRQRRLAFVALLVAALWAHAGSNCAGARPDLRLDRPAMTATAVATVSPVVVAPSADSHADCLSRETAEAFLLVAVVTIVVAARDPHEVGVPADGPCPPLRTPVVEHVVDRS
jgi:hypothetical protein